MLPRVRLNTMSTSLTMTERNGGFFGYIDILHICTVAPRIIMFVGLLALILGFFSFFSLFHNPKIPAGVALMYRLTFMARMGTFNVGPFKSTIQNPLRIQTYLLGHHFRSIRGMDVQNLLSGKWVRNEKIGLCGCFKRNSPSHLRLVRRYAGHHGRRKRSGHSLAALPAGGGEAKEAALYSSKPWRFAANSAPLGAREGRPTLN